MRQAIIGKEKVRREKSQNDQEESDDLDRVCWLLECCEKYEGTLSLDVQGAKCQGGYAQQKQAQEPTHTLSPSESNAWDQIVQDDRVYDAAEWRSG